MSDKDRTRDKDGRISVMLEMRSDPGMSPSLGAAMAPELAGGALRLDPEFVPVPMGGGGEGMAATPQTYVLRGTVADEDELRALEADPQVLHVWRDTPIEPFTPKKGAKADMGFAPQIADNPAMAACPIGTCDCSPRTPHGSIADVARYLNVDQIWAAGYRGAGIVVGVLDGGITAQGRPVQPGETSRRIPRVIGGWPVTSWGTQASAWGEHGNMCATDILGMAPEAQIFDLRIGGSGGSQATISRALQAFEWAINHYRSHGTPQVLSNSWGIFQESWNPAYARNPNHPFTRKVAEAVDLGIIVLFAAGNCGDTCPDGRCGPDTGSGRSIWGANGHDKVMTVGAVNINEQFVGYSSRGPASLSAQKPDFCAITHFTGYHNSDSGTSAATPILAGVCALLRQAKPTATTATMKAALIATCKDIGAPGFDVHAGHGIVQPKGALDRLTRPRLTKRIVSDRISDPIRTLPRFDPVRTRPSLDILRTRPVADRIGTPIVPDRLRTDPRADMVGTRVTLDRPGTHIADRITPGGDPGRPFVLATGHQAPDWQDFDDSGEAGGFELDYGYDDAAGGAGGAGADPEDEAAMLAEAIDALQTQLDALIGDYLALTGHA